MYYYPQNNYRYAYNNNRFIVPFLGGALLGGAAVGLTRPRPIYNVAPTQGAYYPNYNASYGVNTMPYYNSYNYYGGYRPF